MNIRNLIKKLFKSMIKEIVNEMLQERAHKTILYKKTNCEIEIMGNCFFEELLKERAKNNKTQEYERP